MRAARYAVLVFVLGFLLPILAAAETIAVAAAISLKTRMADVAKAYKADTGDDVEFTFGSSGQLMAQIKNGAPVDAFVSAAVKQVGDLAKDKLVDDATRRVVAKNVLVLIVPADAKAPPSSFAELTDERVKRVAVGEPRTVPAGQYAAQALKAMKVDDKLAGCAVYGSNVRQVLDYVVAARSMPASST
jgi:molybdate transport system substrate-binding protein